MGTSRSGLGLGQPQEVTLVTCPMWHLARWVETVELGCANQRVLQDGSTGQQAWP